MAVIVMGMVVVRVLGKELLSAVVTAKEKRLSIAICAERRGFVYRHAADGVDSHTSGKIKGRPINQTPLAS